jgi:hypothetical protein
MVLSIRKPEKKRKIMGFMTINGKINSTFYFGRDGFV